jgi:hypothetical protein
MLERALSPLDSVNGDTVEWWKEKVILHASHYRTIPAQRQLSEALLDFGQLCELLKKPLSVTHRAELLVTTTRISGLIGILWVDLHRLKESREWFATGRSAAQEIESVRLRSWLTSREALACLYYEGPDTAARLGRLARRGSGGPASAAQALAPAVEARALAQLGQRAEAVALIRFSEDLFHKVADPGSQPAALGFSQAKLMFYKGNVLARAGNPIEALDACGSALAAIPVHDTVDRAHVRLDSALALVRAGEVEAASALIVQTLDEIPSADGIGAVLSEAEEVVRLTYGVGATTIGTELNDHLLEKRREFSQAHVDKKNYG